MNRVATRRFHLLIFGILLLISMAFISAKAFGSFTVDNLRGGNSFGDVQRAFRNQKFILVERNTCNDGVRPLFDFHEVKAKGIFLMGVRGTAHFEFFNDQLMEILFTPESPGLGQKAFARTYGRGSWNLRHRIFVTLDGQQIIWRDKKLNRQMDQWIWHYA